ncbi:RagB/SusD family nutrient uptake outer membrane protein [Rhodothermus marinus]|uniref:RagB/SusD family nutrient uptake outer membrane protein n=1 Tax=Rhodothermus marinus TaxID=29549 RepID=UPI000A50AA24|nr:RagB/SusD family nutrient uptake outer membrane protein [Rhodothermus marinus]
MKIRYVARATDVIDKIEKSTASVPEHIKARYIAEAKVLRAWMMYILYDFFGPVNVKLDPATLYSTEITPRPSREEYVAAIERDLQEAIPNLPDKYNDDPANWGRVSKGVARMLLLRLYMHENRWAEAENVARELMNMGYTLMPEYTQICEERNPELIYACQPTPRRRTGTGWKFYPMTSPRHRSAIRRSLGRRVGPVSGCPGTFTISMKPAISDCIRSSTVTRTCAGSSSRASGCAERFHSSALAIWAPRPELRSTGRSSAMPRCCCRWPRRSTSSAAPRPRPFST